MNKHEKWLLKFVNEQFGLALCPESWGHETIGSTVGTKLKVVRGGTRTVHVGEDTTTFIISFKSKRWWIAQSPTKENNNLDEILLDYRRAIGRCQQLFGETQGELKIWAGTHDRMVSREFFYNGANHSYDGMPGETQWWDNKREELWHYHGMLDSVDDKPSVVTFSASPFLTDTGIVKEEEWYQNDVKHRDHDSPAVIKYFENGNVKSEEWYQNNVLHREGDKPAEKTYHMDGTLSCEKYFSHGTVNRDNDKPAIVIHKSPKESHNIHMIDGVLHRDGNRPAKYNLNTVTGEISPTSFAYRGKEWAAGPLACEATSKNTPPDRLTELAASNYSGIAFLAARNPNCPEWAQAQYALTH